MVVPETELPPPSYDEAMATPSAPPMFEVPTITETPQITETQLGGDNND